MIHVLSQHGVDSLHMLRLSVCPLIFMCSLRLQLRVHYWGEGVIT